MNCPCEVCLIKPLCKNKHYRTLHNTCKTIEHYLRFHHYTLHKKRVKELERVLKSHVWKLGIDTSNGYHITKR